MTDYRIIAMDTNPHLKHLEYFMGMMYPQLTITAMVDVTALRQFCKQENCSFFLTFLHITALSADSIPQLRQRLHQLTPEEMLLPGHNGAPTEGPLAGLEIREYEQCPTSHTEAAGKDLYGYCVLRHHMPWQEYITAAAKAQQEAREKGSLEEDKDIESCFFATCLPWIHYCSMTHPVTDRFDSNVRFSWGKFQEDCLGRMLMPLTIVAHHGLADGIHIGRFYENVDKNMAALVEGRLDYRLLR